MSGLGSRAANARAIIFFNIIYRTNNADRRVERPPVELLSTAWPRARRSGLTKEDYVKSKSIIAGLVGVILATAMILCVACENGTQDVQLVGVNDNVIAETTKDTEVVNKVDVTAIQPDMPGVSNIALGTIARYNLDGTSGSYRAYYVISWDAAPEQAKPVSYRVYIKETRKTSTISLPSGIYFYTSSGETSPNIYVPINSQLASPQNVYVYTNNNGYPLPSGDVTGLTSSDPAPGPYQSINTNTDRWSVYVDSVALDSILASGDGTIPYYYQFGVQTTNTDHMNEANSPIVWAPDIYNFRPGY